MKAPPRVSYTARVLRAQDTTAQLTVTHWAGDKPVGQVGPIEQVLMYNDTRIEPNFK